LSLTSADGLLAEIGDTCQGRKTVYAFLSSMYAREVTKEIIAELQSRAGALSSLEPLKELGNAKLNEGLERLGRYLKDSTGRDIEQVRLELAVEYAGLFLSVWGTPAHPSESAYATGGRLVMQKERDQVLAMYRSVGMDKAKDFTEPEDHIAVELQFMSFLADETAKAAGAGDRQKVRELLDLQDVFLEKHLGSWLGHLASDVMKQGRVDFYRGISLIADGFVEEDRKVIKEFLAELPPASKSK
jgi:TorA maturation chaperone TorD